MLPHKALFTTGEVAAALEVDPSTVTRWVRDGKLAAVTLPSGRNRFRREDVEALLGVEPEISDEPAAVGS